MKKGAKSYQQVKAQGQVEDASPHQLILMMFESAIESVRVAKIAIGAGDILLKVVKVNKAFNIVESLRGCLNMEVGGEMAENLDQLYEHLLFQIMQINASNNMDLCDHVCHVLTELLTAWRQIPSQDHHLASLTPEEQGKAASGASEVSSSSVAPPPGTKPESKG